MDVIISDRRNRFLKAVRLATQTIRRFFSYMFCIALFYAELIRTNREASLTLYFVLCWITFLRDFGMNILQQYFMPCGYDFRTQSATNFFLMSLMPMVTFICTLILTIAWWGKTYYGMAVTHDNMTTKLWLMYLVSTFSVCSLAVVPKNFAKWYDQYFIQTVDAVFPPKYPIRIIKATWCYQQFPFWKSVILLVVSIVQFCFQVGSMCTEVDDVTTTTEPSSHSVSVGYICSPSPRSRGSRVSRTPRSAVATAHREVEMRPLLSKPLEIRESVAGPSGVRAERVDAREKREQQKSTIRAPRGPIATVHQKVKPKSLPLKSTEIQDPIDSPSVVDAAKLVDAEAKREQEKLLYTTIRYTEKEQENENDDESFLFPKC